MRHRWRAPHGRGRRHRRGSLRSHKTVANSSSFSHPSKSNFLPTEQTLLEGKSTQHFVAGGRDQHFLFELDAFRSAHLADVALDTDDHARLQYPVAAIGGE